MDDKKTDAGANETEAANIADATGVDPSGAPLQTVADVDMSHPAVDNNPRANTSLKQNKIDFNDPTISGQEAVERNLGYTSNPKAEDNK